MKNIRNDIKTNEYKRIYLIYGEENYLKRLYLGKLIDAIVPDHGMNFTKYAGADFNFPEFREMSDTIPFFAPKRLIVVDKSGLFKAKASKGESIASESKDDLVNYIPNIPDYTVVIFFEDEVDKRGKLFKAVEKNGYASEMKQMEQSDLKKWIGSILSDSNKLIKESTAGYLLEYSGTDMETLSRELEKLVFYAGDRTEIVPSDIDAICSRQISAIIFDLTDAIAKGQKSKAMLIYQDLIANKESPYMILYMLIRHYMQLYVSLDMKEKGTAVSEIAYVLKSPDFVVKKYLNQGAVISKTKARSLTEYGLQLEEDAKTGKISDKYIVELLLAK